MTQAGNSDDVVMILLIIFIPPLAVWWKDRMEGRGCTCHVCLNVLLMFLFVFPALLHAIWYCFCRN